MHQIIPLNLVRQRCDKADRTVLSTAQVTCELFPKYSSSDLASSSHSRPDGLARAKARGAADADIALGICCGGVRYGLHIGVVPDDGPNICWRCGFDYIGDGTQLALLQSPPTQVVGSQRGREASKAAAGCEFEKETH
ncbi:hypothetical protein CJ030_MR1G027832 [Morella rubra]|uniref:Uncharacterized protein n=1 Tax=Morella rubra TaxID=262757 RepID=A0A6A1WKX8_9ROSI|nr:hypothetical protein CJ030_MR1G027832 [Morella rubra]